MECDLHIHTTYSDGSMSVRDVIYYAKKIGLKSIAITDHDSLHVMNDTIRRGEEAGIRIIPGVEATVIDRKRARPVHVLCYLPQRIEILQKFLDTTLESRRKQKMEMLQKVRKIYPLLEEQAVFDCARDSFSIYEPHIMQPLCDLGYANAVLGQLETQLLSKGGSCYVPSNYPEINELLNAADQAGAVIGIAHPEQFDSFELAEELAYQGRIQAIEYDHPRNGSDGRKKICKIAEKYGLIMTGGSDFHGQYAKTPHPMGSYGCGSDVVEKLLMCSKIR